MKKWLTLAVVAAFSSIASAASLNWQIAGITSPSGTKQNLAVYLFITAQSDNFGARTTSVNDVVSFLTSGATLITDGSGKAVGLKKGDDTIDIAASALSTAAGGVPAATGYNGNSFGAGNTLSAFAVVLDASDLTSAQNFTMTAVKDVSWGSSSGAQTARYGSMANATWTPVPEPSTAVLALAGLALLLKRRRA